MDRKTILIFAACFLLLLTWGKLVEKIWPPIKVPISTNAVVAVTNVTTNVDGSISRAITNLPVARVTNAPASMQALPAVAAPAKIAAAEETLVIENDDARYTFSSHWGGLKQVELKRYPAAVGCRGNHSLTTNALATLNSGAPLPALAVFGGAELEGDGVFTLTKTATGVRAEKTIGGLTLVKEFQPGSNYVLKATARVENHGSAAVAVPAQEWIIGTATPMSEKDDGSLTGLFWFNGQKPEHIQKPWFDNASFFSCVTGPSTPRIEWRSAPGTPVWAAVNNQFFTMIAHARASNWLPAGVVGRRVELPPLAPANTPGLKPFALHPVGIQTALTYPGATLQPGGKVELAFDLFAGPKEYYTLSLLPERQDVVMEFTGFFGFFAKALLLSMNALHKVGLGYGWAIVAITVIIKLVFWPLTAVSTRSMKKMQALSPQLNAIKEKYKDDAAKQQQKTMELWKENKVNPASGCLPMLIQLPVFFGFFTMLRSAIELRGAGFLWMCDLSQADTLFNIPGLSWVPFLGVPGVGLPFNLMPLIYIGTALWQSHLTPTSPGMDPAQARMMRWMPLLFLVILYNFSSGLALYWTVQNLLTILQTNLTKAAEQKAKAAGNGAPIKTVTPLPPKKKK
ncbi:MAG: membrane protein insertase YidC [Verrucomicrobia bacterium]|nr:membrane protein insertase YidC [Verrucomicrobiota bacterium]